MTKTERLSLEEGMELFNCGEYFLAHESWESVWKKTRGPQKVYLQCLIILCGCLIHLEKQRVTQSKRLAKLALAKLESLGHSREPFFKGFPKVKGMEVLFLKLKLGKEIPKKYLSQLKAEFEES